ncbi:histone acetyltransferase type B catalytic subunit [Cryptococcus amylolentus CBS 6039]|uniref:Histone acetyltransferase type B catalytic subunit n=2 Tax=Cryptococcus amylolentus TaxID=104669 RepID=A0A1E3HM80_9TREE|nr:histone acetyltransferase type B catalytic subunit [Cryptococcus amylolentus CBS 6039]ODN76816.1 histone acetyltransferase type B catalytic subunit [Cryptococcus amylolentus CBS 6039]ODO04736.1 histone acetyltransferase type B catalytic subunit [Cryptococcus amylolentus CBS 6273]
MAEGLEEWISDSNEVLNLQLVRAPHDADVLSREEVQAIEPFNPSFTYPIFGDTEKIFGYKGLDIKLQFASGSLKQYLNVAYDEKLASTTTPPDEIEPTLYKFIPPDYTKSDIQFETTVKEDAETFKPFGEKLGSYKLPSSSSQKNKKGKGKAQAVDTASLDENSEDTVVFEMYKASWNTPGFREYHRRMQLFILLFIEGGSYVHEDEDAWEFIVLFERRKRPESDIFTYHFAGYVSVYPFWCYPDRVRLRLSQFVILPPYQHQGHGSKLYSTLFHHMLSRPEVAELTVEDPAEAFEDLRDRNDLRLLVKEGLLTDSMFQSGVGQGKREARNEWESLTRKKYKIAQRQFDRLLEMLLLRQLDKKDEAKVKAYRLHVKSRLYRFNYEMLVQMTPEERKEALAKTYDSVVEDYERILEMTFH